jgi:hypothetical protein
LSTGELNSKSPPERIKINEPLASTIASQQFDVLQFARNEQYRVLIHFFFDLGLFTEFSISIGTFLRFLSAASAAYHNVPYHNWNHAMDVTQYIYCLLKTGKITRALTKLELMALLVAGICHDMGHTSKALASTTKSPLALLYKDQPVMEVSHCATAINTMALPNCDILAGLDDSQLHSFWELTIDCVMAMDMTQHTKIIDAAVKNTSEKTAWDLTNPHCRVLLMKLIIKCADLSVLSRPFEVTSPWSSILVEECLASSDGEQLKGDGNSPISGRDSFELARNQINFAQAMGKPLIMAMVKAIPEFQPIADQFELNVQKWRDYLSGTK